MTAFMPQEDEYQGRLDTTLWRRVAGHARPYLRQVILLCVAGLGVAVIDALFPLITGRLIDEAVERGLSDRLWRFGAAYLGLMIGIALCIWLFIDFAGRIATGVGYDLRTQGFRRLQELSFSYFDQRPVGWLVTRLTSDCAKLSSLIPWFLLDFFWGFGLLIGIAAAMMWMNWLLALIVMTIVPPLALVSLYFQRRLLESSRGVRRTNSQMTASFSESLMGVRTTKVLVREAKNLEEFQRLSGAMFTHSMRNSLQSAVYLPMVITLGSIGVGLALWRGGLAVGTIGGLTYGELVAFMQYAALFSMPVQDLARRFTELQAAQAAAERIQTLLDTEPEIKDSDEVAARIQEHRERPDRQAAGLAEDGYPNRIETIEFHNACFWYKADEPVLEDFNLTVRAGETIALVGSTGGGKSTIVNLVSRFYEPRLGRILINGVDYRQRSLHWLQSNLGIVLQTPVLFSGTIRDNIRYGRLDAREEEIEAAAALVNASGFITELEHSYDSEVGEGGSRLSTGQRQLIALARAVLANPQIFILDEATSSVDTETERLIQDGVSRALRGRISFVIAHRLSTIRAADRILVIDDGRIVEQGTHEALMQLDGGRYRALYMQHFANDRAAQALQGTKLSS